MSNLDNLVQKILDDAKTQASAIVDEANKIKEDIINTRTKEAEERKRRILERAEQEANLLKERTISNAELKVRNEKLRAKQEIIEKVFNMAKERLKDLEEDKYVSYLQATLKNLNLKGGETIIVPEKMRKKVKSLKLNLQVSEEETVDSGFLIKDKGIILNYTFESLIDYYRDELEAEIAQSLFKE